MIFLSKNLETKMTTQFTLEYNIFYRSLILTLSALVLLTLSNFSTSAQENQLQKITSESTWEFVNKHPQHLTKHGNITWGNDFLIRINKDCSMNFGALYMSYNNEKLMSVRDTEIEMRLDMVLKEGMNVRVVPFPENEDPDSYAQKKSSEEFA